MPLMTPQEYFDKIRELRTPEQIQAVCEELVSVLFNPTDAPKTRVNKLTPYNKLVNLIPPEKLIEGENAYHQERKNGQFWLRHLHFRYTGVESVNFNGEGGINRSNSKINRLKTQKLIDVTSYLETTLKLLASDKPHELALGLIAASGRRSVEILARGKFSPVKNLPEHFHPDYSVMFRGQAKKRDYGVSEVERTEYPIGLLVLTEVFLKAFDRYLQTPQAKQLHDYIAKNKDADAEDVNAKIDDSRGKSLRRVCQQYFDFLPLREEEKNPSPKVLRAITTVLITERDCPDDYNKLLWASQQLGHFIDDGDVDDRELQNLVTSVGYMDYFIEGTVPFVGEEIKTELEVDKEVDKEVEIVKETISQPETQLPEKPQVQNKSVKITTSTFNKLGMIKQENKFLNQSQTLEFLIEKGEKINMLETENNELKAKVKQLELENNKLKNELNTTDLDKLVEKKIQQQLQNLLPQLKNGEILASIDVIPPTANTPKTRTRTDRSDVDYEGLNREELLRIKSPSAAREKVRRAFLAICNHNDVQPSNVTRWAINNQALRQLSGTNGLIVGEWMKQHETSVCDHNNKYGLTQYHNKGKGDISAIIKWV